MHSYAEFVEMKQASVIYSFAENFACIQMFSPRRFEDGVNWYSDYTLYVRYIHVIIKQLSTVVPEM